MKTVIFCYCMDVEPLNNEELYAKWYDRMSDDRKKKMNKLRFRKDRNLSLGAGILSDYGLRQYGLREKDMRYGVTANEKPIFENAPEISFNLSHSGTKVLAAFFKHDIRNDIGNDIGCDIEMVSAIELDIAKRFFFKSEYQNIMGQKTDQEKTELFFRYWTIKESFMKATGLGFMLALSDFEIVINSSNVTSKTKEEQVDKRNENITVVQTVDRNEYYFREFNNIPGYHCALCHKVAGAEIQFKMLQAQELAELKK